MLREEVENCTILRCLVGSSIHGLELEGTDDRDEMGICVEPLEYVIGLKHFEQFISRDQPEGVRSQPGDLDLVIYSLRKYVSLALKGNPSIMLLLHHPEPMISSEYAETLRQNAWRFTSKHAVRAFLGYATQQRQRLLGERGQMNVKRPELIEKYGYDTKYAMHMIRLGYQGIEFAETGTITLPVREPERSYIMQVRRGEIDLNDVVTKAGELEKELEGYLLDPNIPDDSDRDWANVYLRAVYLDYYGYSR